MTRLTDKICIITGAAKGIGAAIARSFAAEGAKVVVTDVNREAGTALAEEIGATFVHLDVADEEDWRALEDKYPVIDVLVNNAGITGHEQQGAANDPENTHLIDWRYVHAVNLDGTFLGCRYAIRAMRKNEGKGSIINMSSRSGIVGIPGAAAYASSKAAIRNHTKTVALYCAQEGLQIRCNSVHPAAVWTDIWDTMIGHGEDADAKKKKVAQGTPLHRFGRPEEVAALCVLLASDEATFMTGTELTIDGGILAGSASSPGQ
ncbi:MAG: SDR family oxidoreductase [Devosiaceae bacterium]|nr:SDR family oxidoreductase [Devosiaceae bacterium MH13]